MKRLILAALLAAGAMSATGAVQADDALKAVIGGEHRTANAARDGARHPYETLTFFGIKPNMTVVELVPGGGWYTEILAPYLRDQGKYIGAGPAPDKKGAIALRAKFDANPALYGKATMGVFEPPSRYEIAPPGSVDLPQPAQLGRQWRSGPGHDLQGNPQGAETGRRAGSGRPPAAGGDEAGRKGVERLCARGLCDQAGRERGH